MNWHEGWKTGKGAEGGQNLCERTDRKGFNNIRVYIRHVHVRYEGDSELNPGCIYAVGATFESIAMVSTDVFWRPRFQKEFKDHLCNKLVKRLSLKDERRVDGLTLMTVDETCHHTHFHTIHQSKPTLFLSLSTLTQHALAWGHSMIVPTSLFGDCVVSTLSDGSLAEAHNCDCK